MLDNYTVYSRIQSNFIHVALKRVPRMELGRRTNPKREPHESLHITFFGGNVVYMKLNNCSMIQK